MPRTFEANRSRRKASPPWATDLVGAGAATWCAMVTWFFAVHLAGLELNVRLGSEVQRVTGLAIALAAASSALAGYVALRGLERLTPRALDIWTAVGVVVALLSLLGPLAATTPAAKGTLVALHAVVATVVIASAQRSRRRRRAC